MIDETRELYQEMILDHSKRPRNCQALAQATGKAEGYNPLCGDRMTVYVRLEGDRVAQVTFEGRGCAISTASASLMTEALQGKSIEEAQRLFDRFHRMVTSEHDHQDLGKLAVFGGVREYPARVKCATLAWHTMLAVLRGDRATVSTE